jgi:hypothetical protein
VTFVDAPASLTDVSPSRPWGLAPLDQRDRQSTMVVLLPVHSHRKEKTQ